MISITGYLDHDYHADNHDNHQHCEDNPQRKARSLENSRAYFAALQVTNKDILKGKRKNMTIMRRSVEALVSSNGRQQPEGKEERIEARDQY